MSRLWIKLRLSNSIGNWIHPPANANSILNGWADCAVPFSCAR